MKNSFLGRSPRRRFWLQAFLLPAGFAALFVALEGVFGRGATWLLYPPFLTLSFLGAARRYHDLNKSATWLLLLVIPVAGPAWVLAELLFRRGSRGENRYGADPRNAPPEYFRVPDPRQPGVVNDVTGLNPVAVADVKVPGSIEELQALVRESRGPISVGGGRFSMGGQTASPGSLHLDLRNLRKVLEFSPEQRRIRVQAGIRWCDVQRFIDPQGLAVKIMQSYANLSVGGSLSVNCHGRYLGLGPIILSVRSVSVVLANGDRVEVSPTENRDLFYGIVGGYGGLGIIAEAELELVDNVRVERRSKKMSWDAYPEHFRRTVRDSCAVFHNADLYPPDFRRLRSVSWIPTERTVTEPDRLRPVRRAYPLDRYLLWACSESPLGKWRREVLQEPVAYLRRAVHWRNYEAGFDIGELEPRSREKSTYVLQEYFVPVEQYAAFLPKMSEILNRYRVNALNISVRHAAADPGSLLAWARGEVFAFVLYYKQGVGAEERERVGIWTRELIDAALDLGGSYYLPYQVHATPEQFRRAYPRCEEFFALKRKYDPDFRLRNAIWDTYAAPTAAAPTPGSDFQAVYGAPASADRFYRFLQNIFHLYPEDRFHALIREATRTEASEEGVYRRVQAGLPGIKPRLADLTLALPALRTQKREMARQTLEILGSRRTFNGYVEIGSTGRYVSELRKQVRFDGRIVLVNDAAPSNSAADILERGQLRKFGEFLPLNEYQPLSPTEIPDGSVDLVTCYIGLHHAAPERLEPFVRSIARVLRPGGLFILRDHDVKTPEREALVRLAHTVFNAGLGVPWEGNQAERRHFAPMKRWVRVLEDAGLKQSGPRLLQPNDPTDNMLLGFVKGGEVPKVAAAPTEKRCLLSKALPLLLLGCLTLGSEAQSQETPVEHRRGEEQTYLTFPEWFLVFSPAEVAGFLRTQPPSDFPWWGHIGQFWSGAKSVDAATRGRYPYNSEYHTMIAVLGASTTVEYGLKSAYETVIGRVSAATRLHGMTDEDRFAAASAQDYVDFIRVSPFYEYSYLGQLKQLWTETSLWGHDLPRKWERKYAMTTELLLKASYGWVIEKLTRASYDRPRPVTAVVLSRRPQASAGLEILRTEPDGRVVATLPRYAAFTDHAVTLAWEGVTFEEIAGNRAVILVSAQVPLDWSPGSGKGAILFGQPILTEPGTMRVVLTTPVAELSGLLNDLAASGGRVEHVFDY